MQLNPTRYFIIRLLPVTLALLLSACSAPVSKPVEQKSEPILVRVAHAAASNDQDEEVLTGTVRVKREIVLAFKVGGIIQSVQVNEGDRVQQGQRLATLNTTQLQAQHDAAEASYVQARADHARATDLLKQGWTTQQKMDAAEQALRSTRAQLASTSYDLARAVLIAPAAGVVLRRQAEPGQTIAAGTPILTVADSSSGYVLRAPLSDRQVARVKLGQRAQVRLGGLPSSDLHAKISQIGARSDDATGTFQVELSLPQVPGLKSGLIGDAVVALPAAGSNTKISIPATALVNGRADEAFVYVVDVQRKVARAHRLGISGYSDDVALIGQGLAPGDLVIVEGADRVRDGDRVTYAEPKS